LTWGVNTDDKHRWSRDAIERTGKDFEADLTEPVSWFVLSQSRFDRFYQVNIPVEVSRTLLNLTGEFMIALSENYDTIKDEYARQQTQEAQQ